MNYTVSPTQAAHLLGVTPTTVRRWIASGELDARKLGPRRWLIAVESVEALRLGKAPAPLVNWNELRAEIVIAIGELAIVSSVLRDCIAGTHRAGLTLDAGELALEHARSALHAALDRLPR